MKIVGIIGLLFATCAVLATEHTPLYVYLTESLDMSQSEVLLAGRFNHLPLSVDSRRLKKATLFGDGRISNVKGTDEKVVHIVWQGIQFKKDSNKRVYFKKGFITFMTTHDKTLMPNKPLPFVGSMRMLHKAVNQFIQGRYQKKPKQKQALARIINFDEKWQDEESLLLENAKEVADLSNNESKGYVKVEKLQVVSANQNQYQNEKKDRIK